MTEDDPEALAKEALSLLKIMIHISVCTSLYLKNPENRFQPDVCQSTFTIPMIPCCISTRLCQAAKLREEVAVLEQEQAGHPQHGGQ